MPTDIPPTRPPEGSFGQRAITTPEKRAMMGSWKARTRGVFAGLFLGIGTGLVLGPAIAFVPFLFGFGLPLTAAVLACIGTLTTTCALTGMAIGADVGAGAGAVASMFKETRDILNRQTELITQITSRLAPGEQADIPKAEAQNAAASAIEPVSWSKKYLSLKTGLTFIGVGAVIGVALSFGPPGIAIASLFTSGFGLTGALVSGSSTLVGMSATVFGMVGAVFGVNYPRIFSNLQEGFGEMLAGRSPFRKTIQAPSPSPVLQPVLAPALAKTASASVTSEEAALLTSRQKDAADISHVQQLHLQPKPATGLAV